MKKAFKWGRVQFFGGPADSVGDVDYLILLTEDKARYVPAMVSYDVPKKLQRLLPKIKPARVIHVPIKDFAAPAVPPTFFAQIVKAIAKYHKSKSVIKICVSCGAGQGRTGAVLAALAYLLGVTKDDPVLFVRSVYSQDAVETQEQIDWLSTELGIRITAKPPKKEIHLPAKRQQPPVFGWRDPGGDTEL